MSDATQAPCRASISRWGRSPHHAAEHAAAARVQARYPHLIVWFGEASGHYYVMDADGLHVRESLDALTLFVWWRAHRPRPTAEVAR